MTPAQVTGWLRTHPLMPIQVDCATAVMLKILDGKCRMRPSEKVVMALLYDAVRTQPGERLDAGVHDLIREARTQLDEAMKERVYEQRVLAETVISRPVMKGFKAMIREHGLLAPRIDEEEAEP